MSAPTITPTDTATRQDTAAATAAFATGWVEHDTSITWTADLTAELLDVLADDEQAGIYSRQYHEHVVTKALAELGIHDPRPPATVTTRRRWWRRSQHRAPSMWAWRRRRTVKTVADLTAASAQ